MKQLIIIVSLLIFSACDKATMNGSTKTINSDYLNYLCIDNVKYIKTMNQTGHYSLTPKFQSNGTLETCNDQ